MIKILLFIGALLLLVFLWWGTIKLWQKNKLNLMYGFGFVMLFASSLGYLYWLIFNIKNPLITKFLWMPIISVLSFMVMIFFAYQLLLLWNAWIVWKKESHNLGNSLTLLLAIFVILLPIIRLVTKQYFSGTIVSFLTTTVIMLLGYAILLFLNFLIVLALYQKNRITQHIDFIIVLGSGLIGGTKVPPLLRQRIVKAIDIYDSQKDCGELPPKIILSGGQGGDEKIPEGQAMLNYAVTHGIAPADAIAEDKSKNTYENMLFSKAIIDASGQQNANTIFVTSNYHTLRASRLAKQVGIALDGIGAPVSFFFLPNAIIREFIAIYLPKKRMQVFMGTLVILLAAIVTVLNMEIR